MQFKTLAIITVASLVAAEGPVAAQGGAVQGQSGTTVVEETEAGQQQAANPLGPVGALAAAIWSCVTGWAGGI